jgi:hypothetical protein
VFSGEPQVGGTRAVDGRVLSALYAQVERCTVVVEAVQESIIAIQGQGVPERMEINLVRLTR